MSPNQGQLEALRTEAAMAGDHAMVAICTDAISGDPVALAECAVVIEAAAAMAGFLISQSTPQPKDAP